MMRMASTAQASTQIDVEAVHAASRVVTPSEGDQTILPILGVRALLRYRFDAQEVDRRRRARVGAVRDPEILDLLLGLPVGIPVSVEALTPMERSALRLTPPGVVQREAGSVTRSAVYPLRVDLAVVATQGWRAGLEVAGRFAPFCSRVMLLRQWPNDADDLRMQADFYGIGVVVANGADVEVLVAPHPFRPRRFTSAGWQFLEEVYQHVR
jgi:hypothetical protein